jgi:type II secretory pathway pseudopilin PulG
MKACAQSLGRGIGRAIKPLERHADTPSVRRLRSERGFGLLELLMAITMLNVGILAIVAAFNAGALALSRASRQSTATAVADTQMELFRGIKYANIQQTTSEWNSAVADATWTADSVYTSSTAMNSGSPTSPRALVPTVTTCPNSNANSCDPSFTTSGPDGRSYRVDTYLYYDTPTSYGGQVKVVTVVVRNASDLSRSLARETSTFDVTTGS